MFIIYLAWVREYVSYSRGRPWKRWRDDLDAYHAGRFETPLEKNIWMDLGGLSPVERQHQQNIKKKFLCILFLEKTYPVPYIVPMIRTSITWHLSHTNMKTNLTSFYRQNYPITNTTNVSTSLRCTCIRIFREASFRIQ